MKSIRIKDLMVPLSEYATVSESASLFEAVKSLRKAQATFGQNRYKHRAVLVFDGNNHFVGKLSQHDVMEALEPKYKEIRSSQKHGAMHRFGFSSEFVRATREQYQPWEKALENLCEKAGQLKVKDIMYTPGKGEFVNESKTMDEAIHQLIIGRHHSLLVTAGRDTSEIVGVLRLADVFEFASNAMLECIPN